MCVCVCVYVRERERMCYTQKDEVILKFTGLCPQYLGHGCPHQACSISSPAGGVLGQTSTARQDCLLTLGEIRLFLLLLLLQLQPHLVPLLGEIVTGGSCGGLWAGGREGGW